MANENNKILTAEQELELRRPIEDHIGKIQAKIDGLRADGTDKVVAMQNAIDTMKRDKSLTKEEREHRIAAAHKELEQAKAVESKHKAEVAELISEAENYLKAHFDKDYYQAVADKLCSGKS